MVSVVVFPGPSSRSDKKRNSVAQVDVADAARTMVAETLKEDGCLSYAFARDINDPDLIRIAERWESQEALAAHGQSAHMAAFNAAMGDVQCEGAELWLYSGEAVRRLR